VLFERLGATYIKLGQFIASSPTIFPPEYVLEFQKCLDKTQPLPWGESQSIRHVSRSEMGMVGFNQLGGSRVCVSPGSKDRGGVNEIAVM
jgi:aarF domain-containing kinase